MCQYEQFDNMGYRFFKAYIAYAELNFYPRYYENTEEIKTVINSEYWRAKTISNNIDKELKQKAKKVYIIITVSGLALFGIVLLIIYIIQCKKFKENTDEIMPEEDDDNVADSGS